MSSRVQDDSMPSSIGVRFDQSLKVMSIRLFQCKVMIFVSVPNKCVVIFKFVLVLNPRPHATVSYS